MIDLIVTRHAAVRALLIECEMASETTPVLEHVEFPAQVRGLHVAGNIPFYLAQATKSITIPELVIPRDKRGVDLSLETMKIYFKGWRTYEVTLTSYTGADPDPQ